MEMNTDRILGYFDQINAIPRNSKDETRLRLWLQDWARDRGLSNRADDTGNLVIRLPATQGMENRPTVVVQGHMDMVCEKAPGSSHDFSKDPIIAKRRGDWIMADGTSLGADNGIALAYALALAEDRTIKRPPMELLFTVDEETGLNGVVKMAPNMITGTILINLDSEHEGVFTIGCAGGMETRLSLDFGEEPIPPGWSLIKVVVGGLRGGHSGIDIHRQRGNANIVLARVLRWIEQRERLRIAAFHGGTRHNAIARDAEAVIACKAKAVARVKAAVTRFGDVLRQEYATIDPDLSVTTLALTESSRTTFSDQGTRQAIAMLMALPHGVASFSSAFQGVVDTSSNLAMVTMNHGRVDILTSQRSASISRLEAMTEIIHSVAELSGAKMRDGNAYPPWQPDMDSPLLKTAQGAYQDLYGQAPSLQVIHGGLECAIIGERHPKIQMISFGPNIENAHSPSERLHVPSVGRVWRFLVALLAAIGT